MVMRTFFAEFRVDETRRDEFDRVFSEYCATFRERSGAGLNYYELMAHPTDPTRAFVYEEWVDDATFFRHLESAPFLELRNRIRNLGIQRIVLSGFEAEEKASAFDGTPQELPSADDMFDES